MSRRPHIILEALQVRARPAGTARGIMDLCRAMAAEDRGMDFSVLATEPESFGDLDRNQGWRLVDCGGARGGAIKKALFTQWKLPRLVRSLGGDLLHCMQFLGPLRPPCPMVVTVHDLAWVLFPSTIEEPRRTYYRWLVPRTLAHADAITVNSRATGEETARLFPGTAERLSVTPHGTPSWVLDRADGSARDPEERDRPYFLFVGTLEPRKNLTGLLDAYEKFLESEAVLEMAPQAVPDLVFVGGRGWKDSGLRERISALAARGRLDILDYCDDDTLWRHYRRALALVFPSLHEGFGLPILEAMAAGLPVLTSNRGGMREIGGDLVVQVDPEDVIDIAEGLGVMACDAALRNRLSLSGPAEAARWSWTRTAAQTVDVYRGLLGDRRGK